jgi:hypothetical protein
MVKDFIPEGFKPDEEAEELAQQIRLLESSMSRTTTKPTLSRAAQPVPVVAPEPYVNKASIFLDEDEGARKLNGGPRGRVHKRF